MRTSIIGSATVSGTVGSGSESQVLIHRESRLPYKALTEVVTVLGEPASRYAPSAF